MPRLSHNVHPSIDTTSTQTSHSTTPISPSPTTARKRKRSHTLPTTHPKPAPKPRLTADQRSDNHKEAENRRRNGIREEYARLAANTPGGMGLEKSEEKLLVLAADFLRELVEERRRLVEDLEELQADEGMGVRVDLAGWRLDDAQWGGQGFENRCEKDYYKKRNQRLKGMPERERNSGEEGAEEYEEEDSGGEAA